MISIVCEPLGSHQLLAWREINLGRTEGLQDGSDLWGVFGLEVEDESAFGTHTQEGLAALSTMYW